MGIVTWDDFDQLDLRTGEIIEVKDFPEARMPAYKIKVDFGAEIGIKKSSAQIVALYSKEDLLGKMVVGVVNFPPKQIGPFISECLITGFTDENGNVVLTVPDKVVAKGRKLH